MRVTHGIAATIALGTTLAAVGSTAGIAAHKAAGKMKASAASSALIAKGKQLSDAKHCNSCHAADLSGKPKFSPSLRASGELKHYTLAQWATVLDTGVTNNGGKVKSPMPVYHMSKADSAAIYAYYKTLK